MLLDISDVHKSFGKQPVLNGVSMQLAKGKSLALTGESGSGKSTLLHLVGGLDVADRGSIVLDEKNVAKMNDADRALFRRNTVGVVFQQFNLISSLDVATNLSFQARLADKYDPSLCALLVDRLGLSGLERRYPEQLSGGQQQRVAIGRALAARPALILADEPTGNLDETTGDAVMALLLELVDETDAGLLMVTHSTRLASELDNKVVLRQGKVS